MNTDLTTFLFGRDAVRTVVEDGKPLFCAKDVCEILGYANDSDAVRKHCRPKGVAKRDTLTPGGEQEMTFISEGNLFRLILRSRLPAAERFEEFVMDELLPTLRRTGTYTISKEVRDTFGEIDTRVARTVIELEQKLGHKLSVEQLNAAAHQRHQERLHALGMTQVQYSAYLRTGKVPTRCHLDVLAERNAKALEK